MAGKTVTKGMCRGTLAERSIDNRFLDSYPDGMYGPLEAWLAKIWRTSEIELVK